MPMLQQMKTERIDIRATIHAKQLILEAAQLMHKSASDFLLESGLAAAQQALADRRFFALDEKAWTKFCAVLDRPVQAKPRLRKLLKSRGVFD